MDRGQVPVLVGPALAQWGDVVDLVGTRSVADVV
jgi:hypothetical protein